MTNRLKGRTVAVTRPPAQAQTLLKLIATEGGIPLAFPLLSIAPPTNATAFESALEKLTETDWAIFTSSNAVTHGMPAVAQRFPQLPQRLRFAAVGPATSARLIHYGIRNTLVPSTPPYDSEALLALAPLQAVCGQRVMLFRGEGGRELLSEQLRKRGAEVLTAECYRRVCPQSDVNLLASAWAKGKLDAVIVTSSEALRHLVRLAGNAPWLQQCLLCANHARIAREAAQYGLSPVVADSPDDAAVVQALTRFFATENR